MSAANRPEQSDDPWRAAPAAERLWLVAFGVVALAAVASRVHNAFAYPPLHDFDGPGHVLNVLAFREGRLPDPRAWVGFHAPLYHALGAGLWSLLPSGVPVHATLRLLSAAFGVAAVVLAVRTWARFVPRIDAAAAATVALCVPAMAIATSMLGNETACALFITWALARLAALPEAEADAPRHALVTGLAAGLAALAKSTGLVAAGVAAAAYLVRYRGSPPQALRAAVAVALVSGALASPHYLRLMVSSGGSPLAVVSGAALSPELAAEMASQPPGDRRFSDYLSIPWETFLLPVHSAPGMERAVPGLLWASLWADGHAQFLPAGVEAVARAQALLSIGGLLPAALCVAGALRIRRSPALRRAALPMAAFAALMLVAFVRYSWMWPTFAAVKASYLLALLLPVGLALAVGLHGLAPGRRALARGGLWVLSAACVGVTWWGWWE